MHDIVEKHVAHTPVPRVHRTPAVAPAPIRSGEGARALVVRPLAPHARLSLRLRADVARGIGTLDGLPLDRPVNTFVANGFRSLVRLGPDEWLVREDGGDAARLAATLAQALGDTFHALVDVSHRNVGFAIEGAHAADALAAGCPLDLAPAAFPEATATRTVLAKAEIVLLRTGQARFEVECWRSFADYVRGFLASAARDV